MHELRVTLPAMSHPGRRTLGWLGQALVILALAWGLEACGGGGGGGGSSPAPTTGSLQLTVQGLPGDLPIGSAPLITVTGPNAFTQDLHPLGTATLAGLVPGTYTLTRQNAVVAPNLDYYPATSPASLNLLVSAGATASATVIFTHYNQGVVEVSATGLPAGAAYSFSLDGPGSYHQALSGLPTVLGLADGTYTLTADDVIAGGGTYQPTPRSQPLQVSAGKYLRTATVTYALAYSVSGNAGVAAALLTYPGGTATADGAGAYRFLVPANWSGTVTPSLAGYSFSPASRSYTNVNANLTAQDYTAVSLRFTLSGQVGVANAQVTFTGGSTAADGAGTYSFTVPYGWSGTVTPSLAGYSFIPASRSYTNVTTNQTAQNFTPVAAAITLSGNAGVAKALVTYTGGSTTADGTGAYSFSVATNWSGTVTPSLPGYGFTPASRTYSNLTTSQAGQNFTAAPNAPVSLLTLTPSTDTILNYSQTPAALNWTLTGVPEHLTLDGLALPVSTATPLPVIPHLRHAFTLSAWNSLNAAPFPSLTTGNLIVRGLDLLAGNPTAAGSANGGIAYQGGTSSARFNAPHAVAMDTDGTIYIADTGNNVIRRISTQGTVDTFATGFSAPQGIAVGKNHYIYVADTGNHALKRISPAGVVTVIDPGGALPLWSTSAPTGIATDLDDPGTTNTSVWVADTQNNQVDRFVIRPDGSLFFATVMMGRSDGLADTTTTEAELAGTTTFGDALQAPTGVGFYLDPGKTSSGGYWSRGLYVVQQGGILPATPGSAYPGPLLAATNRRTVIRVNADGGPGVFEAGTSSTSSDQPDGVAVDPATGNAYLTDHVNHVIRFQPLGGTASLLAGTPSVNLIQPGNLVGFSGAVGTLSAPTGVALVPRSLDPGVDLTALQLGRGDLLITTGHALMVATSPGP